ncbi:hypothetical protein D3C81_1330650 [compost metagenome]
MSKKQAPTSSSPFSNFFRNASKAERENLFKDVARQATEAQKKTLCLADAITKAADLTQALMDNLDDRKAAKELHELMESFGFDDQVTITKRASELLIQRRTGAA